MRHERFSFYGPRKSDVRADTDLKYIPCWLNRHTEHEVDQKRNHICMGAWMTGQY